MINFSHDISIVDVDLIFDYKTINNENIVEPQKIFTRIPDFDMRNLSKKIMTLNEEHEKYLNLYSKFLAELMLKKGILSYRKLLTVDKSDKELRFFKSHFKIDYNKLKRASKYKDFIYFTPPNDNNEELKVIDDFINKFHPQLEIDPIQQTITVSLSKEMVLQKINKDHKQRIVKLQKQYFDQIAVYYYSIYIGQQNGSSVIKPIYWGIVNPHSVDVIAHLIKKRIESLDYIISDFQKNSETMKNEYPAIFALLSL